MRESNTFPATTDGGPNFIPMKYGPPPHPPHVCVSTVENQLKDYIKRSNTQP